MRLTSSTLFAMRATGPQFSIAYSQQVFPLAEVSLEAHALGDLKCGDEAELNLLRGPFHRLRQAKRYFLRDR
jgi:hypothetical protein